MVGDPNDLIAQKDLEARQKIIDTQQRIKCVCVFWEPWECSRIRHIPDNNYEACSCICHKVEEDY